MNRNRLIPHEMRPGNSTKATIESNRLGQEIRKLERDKRASISLLAASQVQLHKGLQKIMTSALKASEKVSKVEGVELPQAQALRPSGLNVNAGASRSRQSDHSTRRHSPRITDPDALATASTKSFHGKIIGGQAQIQRRLSSTRGSLLSQTSLTGTASTQRTAGSRQLLQPHESFIYNIDEDEAEGGAATGITFTKNDVSRGVQDTSSTQAGTSDKATPTIAIVVEEVPIVIQEPSDEHGMQAPALDGSGAPEAADATPTESTQPSEEPQPVAGTAPAGQVSTHVIVPEMPHRASIANPDLQDDPEVISERKKQKQTETKIADSVGKTQPRWSMAPRGSIVPSFSSRISEVKGHLSRLSRLSSKTDEAASSRRQISVLPSYPNTIIQEVYCRAVERAFSTKCLKHSKFITDTEMNEFVLDYLMVEQQNENFTEANRFVEQIVGPEVNEGYTPNDS